METTVVLNAPVSHATGFFNDVLKSMLNCRLSEGDYNVSWKSLRCKVTRHLSTFSKNLSRNRKSAAFLSSGASSGLNTTRFLREATLNRATVTFLKKIGNKNILFLCSQPWIPKENFPWWGVVTYFILI